MKIQYVLLSILMVILILLSSFLIFKLTHISYESARDNDQVVQYYLIENKIVVENKTVPDYNKQIEDLLDFKIIDTSKESAQKKEMMLNNQIIEVKTKDRFDKNINPDPVEPEGQEVTNDVDLWHYQLQETNYEKLKALNVNYLIIDPDDSDLTKSQIAELKKNKQVYAYLSIGEAEDYRDYWKSSWRVGTPDFIVQENPNWAGNYLVKFWDEDWQEIILDRVEEIDDLGYTGLYLDRVDVFYEFENKETDMVDFVRRIWSRSDMKIITQNGVELYDQPEFNLFIDGMGIEDTWYDTNRIQNPDHTNSVLNITDRARAEGKFILSIDYPQKSYRICEYYQKCSDQGYSCLVSNRALDRDEAIAC